MIEIIACNLFEQIVVVVGDDAFLDAESSSLSDRVRFTKHTHTVKKTFTMTSEFSFLSTVSLSSIGLLSEL